MFAAALNAKKVLYNFMAMRATNVLPAPTFLVGETECFRPSTTMLTSLEVLPGALPVEIPPLYDGGAFDAALRAGHGK